MPNPFTLLPLPLTLTVPEKSAGKESVRQRDGKPNHEIKRMPYFARSHGRWGILTVPVFEGGKPPNTGIFKVQTSYDENNPEFLELTVDIDGTFLLQ